MSRLASALLLAAALAACARPAAPSSCQSTAQCPEGSRCNGGVCTADKRPLAAVGQVGAVEAFALVQLDGSGSRDPDTGDAIAEHRWTVRSVDAPCAPPEIASRDPQPWVRFGCPGRYQVALVVTDLQGIEGEPATAEVEVTPASGDATVLAGPDVATEHACRGTPLLCRTESRIALFASANPGLTLRWSVLPPADRPLDANRRVRFLPDAGAAAPEAVLETDGTAISGDWIFRVETYDAYGVVGAAHTRVSVRNRAPVVAIAPSVPFPHLFDPSRSTFVSAGELAWAVVDPDGDPVEVTGLWRHVGDGDGASFDGDFADSMVTFTLEVPYAVPEDAFHLIGGADLSRTIELYALDVNRTQGSGVAEIRVGNRPPMPAGGAIDKAVPHWFDVAGSRYVATARVGSFVDPDGDPLFGASGDGPCGAFEVNGNDATAICTVPFSGVPALDRLAGRRTFPVLVRDPWNLASNVPIVTLDVLNTPPTIAGRPAPATMRAMVDGIMSCFYFSATFDVAPTIGDPDGDPVAVTAATLGGGSVSPSAAVCTTSECLPFHFVQPHFGAFCPGPYEASSLTASDGAARVRLDVTPAPRF
jgi:hypothetical protein